MTSLFKCAQGTVSSAVIDKTGQYRYLLERIWDDNEPPAVFIILNPSTADETENDPTIVRCINFAKRWGCGGIRVVNVFAIRSTDPREIFHVDDPVGPSNEAFIKYAVLNAGIIIAAWGAGGPKEKWPYQKIFDAVKAVGAQIYCLGKTKHGIPRHPLYLRGGTTPKLIEEINDED